MDIYHKFFSVARREVLHSAPYTPNYDTHRILDIGTGTGIWAIDMAEFVPPHTPLLRTFTDASSKYQEAEVTGFDISLIQPERYVFPPQYSAVVTCFGCFCSSGHWLTRGTNDRIPPNLQFRRRDVEAPWAGLPMDNWDLIHIRMMCGSISSWPELYANVFRYGTLRRRMQCW